MKPNIPRMLRGDIRWPFSLIPFPGQNPLRLYVTVEMYLPEKKTNVTRFRYSGKFTPSVLKAARRIANKIENQRSRVLIYCKSGCLYNGSLEQGIGNPMYYAFFPNTSKALHNRTVGVHLPLKLEPLKIGRTTVYFNGDNDPKGVLPLKEKMNFARLRYTQVMRGEL